MEGPPGPEGPAVSVRLYFRMMCGRCLGVGGQGHLLKPLDGKEGVFTAFCRHPGAQHFAAPTSPSQVGTGYCLSLQL